MCSDGFRNLKFSEQKGRKVYDSRIRFNTEVESRSGCEFPVCLMDEQDTVNGRLFTAGRASKRTGKTNREAAAYEGRRKVSPNVSWSTSNFKRIYNRPPTICHTLKIPGKIPCSR